MTYHYFEDKPFALQIRHERAWWVSDYFDTIEAAREVGKKKVTPWRVVRISTGEVVSRGNPVWITATTLIDRDFAFDIFDWNRWLHQASIMQLRVEVMLLEDLIVIYADLWQLAEGEQREKVAAKVELFDSQRHAANIEIQKRLQSQYVAVCEN